MVGSVVTSFAGAFAFVKSQNVTMPLKNLCGKNAGVGMLYVRGPRAFANQPGTHGGGARGAQGVGSPGGQVGEGLGLPRSEQLPPAPDNPHYLDTCPTQPCGFGASYGDINISFQIKRAPDPPPRQGRQVI